MPLTGSHFEVISWPFWLSRQRIPQELVLILGYLLAVGGLTAQRLLVSIQDVHGSVICHRQKKRGLGFVRQRNGQDLLNTANTHTRIRAKRHPTPNS